MNKQYSTYGKLRFGFFNLCRTEFDRLDLIVKNYKHVFAIKTTINNYYKLKRIYSKNRLRLYSFRLTLS